jgi:endonuclease/exonuclease/phosphatase family metal-dependent hydrolase
MAKRRVIRLLLIVLALAVLYVLNASRPGARVEGCMQDCASRDQHGEGPLRVMSLNMLHGFPRFEHPHNRLQLIADEIRLQEPDIVLLQEVPWRWGLGGNAAGYLADGTGMNHLYLRANGNRWAIFFEEGEAILSRYPLEDPTFTELKPRAGFFEHRVVLSATVVTPQGPLRLFVTHLTNGAAEVNLGQTEGLFDFVMATGVYPAIVAGDLNAREDSPQIEYLSGSWTDTYRTLQPEDPGSTCCVHGDLTQPDQPLKSRIDYVFLVPGEEFSGEVVAIRRIFDHPYPIDGGWLWASDHVGLLVEINLRAP